MCFCGKPLELSSFSFLAVFFALPIRQWSSHCSHHYTTAGNQCHAVQLLKEGQLDRKATKVRPSPHLLWLSPAVASAKRCLFDQCQRHNLQPYPLLDHSARHLREGGVGRQTERRGAGTRGLHGCCIRAPVSVPTAPLRIMSSSGVNFVR